MKETKMGRPAIKPAHPLIRTTVAISSDLHKKLKREASIGYEGNVSRLLREIFEERYKLKKK